MTFEDDVKVKAREWIGKGIKHAATALVGLSAALIMKYTHIPLSDEHQASLAVLFAGAMGAALNIVKQKYPNQFGWL